MISELLTSAKPKEARQLIAHKHVAINNRIINIPSYIVKSDEDDKIKVFKKQKTIFAAFNQKLTDPSYNLAGF